MKRTVLEKSFVAVMFGLVIIAFSFAERDTQKLFEKYNTKSTVETSKQKVEYTAEANPQTNIENRSARN